LNLSSENLSANGALSVVAQFEVLRLATRSRETGIYLQSIASRSREIAADIPATGIDSRFPLRLDWGDQHGDNDEHERAGDFVDAPKFEALFHQLASSITS
jgi:hypothetical protein